MGTTLGDALAVGKRIAELERKAVLAGKLTKAVLRYDNPWPPSAVNWQGILVLAREFQKAKEE